MRSTRVAMALVGAALTIGGGLAISSALAATAAAAPPEFGRCVPVTTPKTGEYTGAHCTRPAGGKGQYDFIPAPGQHPKFSGTSSEAAVLEMPKLRISCAAETLEGEYTGPKTASVKVDLIGCVDPATGVKCQSNPLKEGEIEPPGSLEGEIGFVDISGKRLVGLDLKRSPAIGDFSCGEFGGLPEATGAIEGSLIGRISPLNAMQGEFKLQYRTAGGKQIPESFEGASKDTLTVQLLSGLSSTTEAAAFKEKRIEILNEEAIEIKAK